MIHLLIEQGHANVNHKNPIDGTSPLHVAARLGNESVIRYLIEVGNADVSTEDKVSTLSLSI